MFYVLARLCVSVRYRHAGRADAGLDEGDGASTRDASKRSPPAPPPPSPPPNTNAAAPPSPSTSVLVTSPLNLPSSPRNADAGRTTAFLGVPLSRGALFAAASIVVDPGRTIPPPTSPAEPSACADRPGDRTAGDGVPTARPATESRSWWSGVDARDLDLDDAGLADAAASKYLAALVGRRAIFSDTFSDTVAVLGANALGGAAAPAPAKL